jgi:hypothetical protein
MFAAGIHVMGCWVANRFRTNWDHSSFRQTLNSIGGSLQSFHRNTRIPECKTAGNHLAKITEDWFEPVSARPVPCIFWDLPHVEAVAKPASKFRSKNMKFQSRYLPDTGNSIAYLRSEQSSAEHWPAIGYWYIGALWCSAKSI